MCAHSVCTCNTYVWVPHNGLIEAIHVRVEARVSPVPYILYLSAIFFLSLLSPSPSTSAGSRNEEAPCSTIQCPPPSDQHLPSTSSGNLSYFPPTARSRHTGECLACPMKVSAHAQCLLCVPPPCSPRRGPDAPCPWKSPLSSSRRCTSTGSVITGSPCHQEAPWSVTKGLSIRGEFQMGMGDWLWLQKLCK